MGLWDCSRVEPSAINCPCTNSQMLMGRCCTYKLGEATYKDDLTGQLLPPDLVRAARAKELEYFEAKEVWNKRPVGEARRVTGKPPISVRWVDVNKGDNQCPHIRSRLVARQI